MPFEPRQIRLFLFLFAGSIAFLAAAWFFILRTEFVPAYQNIRPSDASQIVAELDEAGIPYRLENSGQDILVPEEKAAETRVIVAGSSISMGGTVGFELFNENDIGLTEFAQKINLQRAVQGELARTIMMMDGVEFARVHLAIPERTLFRSEQASPTAAVTVEMRDRSKLTETRVAGIRQLVSSSVPGLSLADVAVLNETGGLVSTNDIPKLGNTQLPNERSAIEQLLTIRASEAITKTLPQQPFELEVSAFERIVDEIAPESEANEDARAPQVEASKRTLLGSSQRALRILFRSPQLLSDEERDAVSMALANSIELSFEQGDILDFTTGALSSSPEVTTDREQQAAIPSVAANAEKESSWSDVVPNDLWSRWLLIPLALFGLILLVIWPRKRLTNGETESFAEMLKSVSIDESGRTNG